MRLVRQVLQVDATFCLLAEDFEINQDEFLQNPKCLFQRVLDVSNMFKDVVTK